MFVGLFQVQLIQGFNVVWKVKQFGQFFGLEEGYLFYFQVVSLGSELYIFDGIGVILYVGVGECVVFQYF